MLPRIDPRTVEGTINHMDAGYLQPIVDRALGETVTVQDWQATLLGGLDSSPFAGGVYRVSGTAGTGMQRTRPWSVVVKVLRSPQGLVMPDGTHITREMAEDQRSFGYWRRELLAAQSGLLEGLPPGLRAPRNLGVTCIDEGQCWLWQEYIAEDRAWNWDDYREAAYRLGRWQGAPEMKTQGWPWLSRKWLAGWVHGPQTAIMDLVEQMNGWRHPLLATHFSPEELGALKQLWADRQRTLDRLAQLPQIVAHLDAYRANLVWQNGDLVLLDWAFVGLAALGEELAAFVGATLLLDLAPLVEAEQLEAVAFDGYLAGLRDAGWVGEEAHVWEAYRCAMPLRYAPITLASMLRTVIEPGFAGDWKRKTGKPLEEILAHRAGLLRFYLSRAADQSSHTVSKPSSATLVLEATAAAYASAETAA